MAASQIAVTTATTQTGHHGARPMAGAAASPIPAATSAAAATAAPAPERGRRAGAHRSAQPRPLTDGHDGGADERGRRPGREHRRIERAGIEVQAGHHDEVGGVALDDRDRERVATPIVASRSGRPGAPQLDEGEDHGHHHDDGAVERERRREERAGQADEHVQSSGAAARRPGQNVCDPAGEPVRSATPASQITAVRKHTSGIEAARAAWMA